MRFFSKKFKKKKKDKQAVEKLIANTMPMEDELMLLTDQVLENTKVALWQEYHKRVARYNVKNKPLGKAEAVRILESLLWIATSKRKMLNNCIERSVSEGSLYQRYYNKVAVINSLTNDAYLKMKVMKRAEERLELKKSIYSNVTGHMYIERMVRVAQQPLPERMTEDIGIELDNALGDKQTVE